MAGTRPGGLLAAQTNKQLHGEDFYRKIGVMGGKGNRGNAADKGFATMDKEKHLAASRKGGSISRRRK